MRSTWGDGAQPSSGLPFAKAPAGLFRQDRSTPGS
jgi:hypothetical protein